MSPPHATGRRRLFPIASPGQAAISTSTRLPPALGKTSYCTRWCRPSSSALDVAVLGVAACSARAQADMARSRMRCATPIPGRPRPVIQAIRASGYVICPTCQRCCARSVSDVFLILAWVSARRIAPGVNRRPHLRPSKNMPSRETPPVARRAAG
jgi:hypothetical protein